MLALAALPGVGRARSVKPLLWLQGALLTAIVGLGLAGILAPSLVPGVPEAGSPAAWTFLMWAWPSTRCWRCAPHAPSC